MNRKLYSREARSRRFVLASLALVLVLGTALPGEALDSMFFATVNAPSGVNLRKAPSKDAAIIRKLANGTNVELVGRIMDSEEIDGKADNWFKILCEDERGWIFGPNLSFEEPEDREAVELYGLPMMKTGDFHGDEIDAETGEAWIGLFPTKDSHVWRKVVVEVSMVHDPVTDSDNQKTGKRVTIPGDEAPVFLLKGMEIPTENAVKLLSVGSPGILKSDPPFPGRTEPDNILHFGTNIEMAVGSGKSLLYVSPDSLPESGKVAAEASVTLSRDGIEQEVLRVRGYHPEDPQMKLLHAGDFDGDGEIDLLLDESNHYNRFTMVLFLSSKARKGELVKRVAYFRTLGC